MATSLNRVFADLLHEGLSAEQKWLPTQFLYDERGSKLFDDICELDEYYLTRTELSLLSKHGSEMADAFGKRACLVEFGAGSSVKIRNLLDHMSDIAQYVPVDIADGHLQEAAANLQQAYPHVRIRPVVADFTRDFALPAAPDDAGKTAVLFPGSTIGNFERGHAASLLKQWTKLTGHGGFLLIGVDLKKDPAILEAAYDDKSGVTAKFITNLLTHANREVGTDFDAGAFAYMAKYNEAFGRIDMYLTAKRKMSVRVEDRDYAIAQDEPLLVEYSHKYSLDEFAALAKRGGFSVERVWTDAAQLFSVQLLVAD